MKTTALFLLLTTAAQAGPRSSASYSSPTESTDVAGRRATSAAYTANGSFGGIAGTATTTGGSAKTGYIAQLTEATAIQLIPNPAAVKETQTLQLSAAAQLDDGTTAILTGPIVAWGILSGPIASISAAGVATAGAVSRHRQASIQGTHDGLTATADLTVLNFLGDNFGIYAGDGIRDIWQTLHFGDENPLGLATADPDGDGQTNLSEYLAGTTPDSATSLFTARAISHAANTLTMEVSRVQPGTRYIFEETTDFTNWTPVFTLTPTAVAEPFQQPLPTSGPRGIFRVRLTAP